MRNFKLERKFCISSTGNVINDLKIVSYLMFILNFNSCLSFFFLKKRMNILSILKDQRPERLPCSCVVLLPLYFFLHSDILGLAYLKSLILKIRLCIRMCIGEGAAAPFGVPCSSRDTESQGCCSWRRSSSELLPHRWWYRYCSCRTGQGMEMCCITLP